MSSQPNSNPLTRGRTAADRCLAGQRSSRSYRIGIDVGGTFTKAVLIDNATREVVGRHSVLTTHAACQRRRRGRGRGVPQGARELGRRPRRAWSSSPTARRRRPTRCSKATWRPWACWAWPSERAAALAEKQARVAPIELGPGRVLATANRFLVTDRMGEADVRQAIAALVAEGAQVLVASSAFGVDNTGSEELVRKLGSEAGLLTTCGHEITRLYGLTTRTRTAVINASILPRMIATANDDGSQRARGRHRGAPDDHARRRRRHEHRRDAAAAGHDDAVGPGGQRRGRAHAPARLRRPLLRGRRHIDQHRRDPQRPPDRDLRPRRRPRDLCQLARRAGDRHRRRQPGAREPAAR